MMLDIKDIFLNFQSLWYANIVYHISVLLTLWLKGKLSKSQ